MLDDDALRRCGGIEVRQLGEPVEARGSVPRTVPAIGLLEVVGERPGIGFREAERAQPVVGVQAETSGRGFRMPTPCSRLVDVIAWASATIA